MMRKIITTILISLFLINAMGLSAFAKDNSIYNHLRELRCKQRADREDLNAIEEALGASNPETENEAEINGICLWHLLLVQGERCRTARSNTRRNKAKNGHYQNDKPDSKRIIHGRRN